MANKCFWDQDTDFAVTEVIQNDNLFFVVNVYGIYMY